jgi:succinate dehydrogenase / fumarate reductase, iron-sulfur subunit
MAKKVPPFKPPPARGRRHVAHAAADIDRIQEFRKCIECFLCQDVCHVIRDHQEESFAGPRFLIYTGGARHAPARHARPARAREGRVQVGLCNITKCCTEVCPEHIHITDNAIIPLKERVADDYYDPVRWLLRKVRPEPKKTPATLPAAAREEAKK